MMVHDKAKEYHKSRIHVFSNDGFSLIEAMIALVVLLVGILGIMGMQYYAVYGNTASRELKLATTLALEKVEEIKFTPYAGLSSNGDSVSSTDTDLYAGQTYTRRWWIVADCLAVNLTNAANPCADTIASSCAVDPDAAETVDVSAVRSRGCWQDKNGTWHSVTIDSLRWDENVTP